MNSAHVALNTALEPGGLLEATAGPTPERAEVSFLEAVRGRADCLQLRPQQRVPLPPAEKMIGLREGMLAVDAMPAKGKLQVLDFLVAGDVISVSTFLSTPGISLRAITRASLVSLDPPTADQARLAQDYWAFLIQQCWEQHARVNIHQLMVGRLEAEPRIASFLLSLALKNRHEDVDSATIVLPMSRTDIANYLVINCDTLSRTMMRLCDSGIIERISRHAIRIVDLQALRRKSPLAGLLSSMIEKNKSKNDNRAETHLNRSASCPSVRDEASEIQSAAEISQSSRAAVECRYTLHANEADFRSRGDHNVWNSRCRGSKPSRGSDLGCAETA